MTPGIPSEIDTAKESCDNGNKIPVSDEIKFKIINNTGPVVSDIKALLKGFLFLQRKCINAKTTNEIKETNNKTNILIPQNKKDYRN